MTAATIKMKPHPHAEVIKAWADGAEIEFAYKAGKWEPVIGEPRWSEDFDYRVKPAESERVYPVTQMTEAEFQAACKPYEKYYWPTAFANAALRHAIDAGQVVTREEFDKMAAELEHAKSVLAVLQGARDARDMKVASAVAQKVCNLLETPLIIDLEGVISKIDDAQSS